MSGYTPGPWRVEGGAAYAGPPIVVTQSGVIVGGFMGSGTRDVAEDNANARLCAAAPDLLASLCDLVALVEMDDEACMAGTDLWTVIQIARCAIDGAEGDTKGAG